MAYARMSAALAMTLLSATIHNASACWPGPSEATVQKRFNYPPSTAESPIHLPANAAGVVYLTRQTMHEADFAITEAGTRRRLPVKLTVLQALKPEKTERPQPPSWSDAVTGLRIGPSAGFKPGTAYRIAAAGESVHVMIDHGTVDMSLQKVQLGKDGAPNREYYFSDAGGCSMPSSGTAVYQATTQVVPRALQPYLARMYGVDHAPVPSGNPIFEQRPFIRYYLSTIQVSDSGPMQLNRLHSVGAGDKLEPPPRQLRMAHYAFFEVDDAWYETNVLDLTPVPGTIERKDSLDFLREVLRGKDMVKLRTQLDATPVRQTSVSPAFQRRMSTAHPKETDQYAPWAKVADTLADWRYQRRHRALTQALIQLARHPDAGVRTSALGAIGRLMQSAEPDELAARNVAKALRKALGDAAPSVRQGSGLSGTVSP